MTDRNDLVARDRPFAFRTHPAAVRAFVRAGVDAFSLASDHALGYGLKGGGETLKRLSAMSADRLLAWPDLGCTRALLKSMPPRRWRSATCARRRAC